MSQMEAVNPPIVIKEAMMKARSTINKYFFLTFETLGTQMLYINILRPRKKRCFKLLFHKIHGLIINKNTFW